MDVALTSAAESDPVFGGLPKRFKVVQWHSVRVAQPPEGAVILAKSDACPCQAMRVGRNAWSMQYHVEVEENTIVDWGNIPAYAEALERTHGSGALPRMAEAAKPHSANFAADAATLYRNFMAEVRSHVVAIA